MAGVAPARVVNTFEKLRFGLQRLRRKLIPRAFAPLDFISELWSFQIAFTLTELRVWDVMAQGKSSADQLAAATGANADALFRLLRAATNLDLVRESGSRCFELLPLGRALCEGETETFRDYLIFMGRHGWRFWGRLRDCARTGQTGIELETGKGAFDYFTGSKDVAEDFNRAMTAISNVTADAVAACYDFAGLKTIVDIGGGHGRLLGGVLKKIPAVRGILFDLPSVVAGSERVLGSLGVQDRCEVVGGSFFENVPAGGDLYMMKTIIHDWTDKQSVEILRAVRKAMPPHGKLIVVEAVVPGPNEKHFAKFLDIEMLVHAGGRERTKDEYAALFVESGLRLTRVIPLPGPASIVEAAVA
jgi:hypothetical protein